jgi:metallophosphoesterase superfamily enzyme
MNEDILKQFDELPAGSTIINLGDIALNSSLTFDKLKGFVDRMKKNDKKLWIVLGNHDREMNLRVKDLKRFKTPYDLFIALGFDRVFPFPILLEGKYLLSHEPVYLKPGSNLKQCYGHVHDCDIPEDYFCHEVENFAMMQRVQKEGITQQENIDVDCEAISDLTKVIDLNNYKNMCWDKHHRILKFEEVM